MDYKTKPLLLMISLLNQLLNHKPSINKWHNNNKAKISKIRTIKMKPAKETMNLNKCKRKIMIYLVFPPKEALKMVNKKKIVKM